LDKLDDFTLNLVENPEVLAIDQDSLGKQATIASNQGNLLLIYIKALADGSKAMAFYNLSDKPSKMMALWQDLGISGTHTVRDLWREKDLGQYDGEFTMTVASHGAELVKILP
jgi:alpha-galactosidase